jgi:hypothetical protein
MKRWMAVWMVIAAMFAVSCNAHADEASKRAKAEKLMGVMHMDRTMSQMMDAMKTQMDKAILQSAETDSMSDAQKKILADFETQAMQLISESVKWQKIEPEYVTLYATNFSEEEIDGMLTFYNSPVGQAVLEKMPTMLNESMQIAQKHVESVMPQIKALQDKLMQQMKDSATP